MPRRLVFFAALAGAIAAAVGVFTLGPFGSAAAHENRTTTAGNDQLLNQLGQVELGLNEEGGIAFSGTMSEEDLAESRAMNHLAESGPNAISCDGNRPVQSCVAVEGDVVEAIGNGETVYGRTVWADVSRGIDSGEPLFEREELLCDESYANGALSCSAAGDVQPAVPVGQTMLVTYRPWRITVDENGEPVYGVEGEAAVGLVSEG